MTIFKATKIIPIIGLSVTLCLAGVDNPDKQTPTTGKGKKKAETQQTSEKECSCRVEPCLCSANELLPNSQIIIAPVSSLTASEFLPVVSIPFQSAVSVIHLISTVTSFCFRTMQTGYWALAMMALSLGRRFLTGKGNSYSECAVCSQADYFEDYYGHQVIENSTQGNSLLNVLAWMYNPQVNSFSKQLVAEVTPAVISVQPYVDQIQAQVQTRYGIQYGSEHFTESELERLKVLIARQIAGRHRRGMIVIGSTAVSQLLAVYWHKTDNGHRFSLLVADTGCVYYFMSLLEVYDAILRYFHRVSGSGAAQTLNAVLVPIYKKQAKSKNSANPS